ncbi:MAG: hypothetical protein D6715_10525, partial [Calditrichaeota bacterium]
MTQFGVPNRLSGLKDVLQPGLLILALLLLACAGGNRFHPNRPPAAKTQVIIHNNNFLDMWVYLERGSD